MNFDYGIQKLSLLRDMRLVLMINKKSLKQFFFPIPRRGFLIRILIIVVVAFIVFRFIAVPSYISGRSMEPTYRDKTFVFYLPWLAMVRSPQIGDVVMVRMAGHRVMLMKRIVAMEGDIVEFKNGWLYVNGKLRLEPYIIYRNPWQLEPRIVKPGHVYVVGDNRGMSINRHAFGQTEKDRIAGYPLW